MHAVCYKTLKLLLKGYICPNVLTINFFQNLIVEDMKSLKNTCPIHFFCCVWEIKFLKPSYLQQVKSWKKKFIAKKNTGQRHSSNNRFKFLHLIESLGTKTLQNCQNLDHCPIHKFFNY